MSLMFVTMVLSFVVMMATPIFAITWYPPITGFQDDDMEWFFDSDAPGTAGYGILSAGDRLYGVVEYEQTYSIYPSGSDSSIPPQELTGVFDLTIVAVNSAFGVSQIVFGPTAGSTVLDPSAPAGTLVSFYIDNGNDLNIVGVNCTSDADCIAKAKIGTPWADFGFAGDADESWITIAPSTSLSPSAVAAGQPSTNFGGFNYFVSVLTNNTGQTIGLQDCTPLCTGGDGMIQIIGSGNILGGAGLNNGAFARSDADTQVPTTVPEPSTLLLLGAGLLGVATYRRRM